ncbi:MAG TPA: hypothetical protein VHA82_08075 [Ramlibacter sp.]|uniref:hypothetical protein n=1 Tax=Ramlibacter sp. TaxID=1917967 RepID=UPI002CF5EC3F|nr:hypothetical protein [Ramlibacter sp.]HVZ43754.1 hypothetical protein [Ramlibacter sp.]
MNSDSQPLGRTFSHRFEPWQLGQARAPQPQVPQSQVPRSQAPDAQAVRPDPPRAMAVDPARAEAADRSVRRKLTADFPQLRHEAIIMVDPKVLDRFSVMDAETVGRPVGIGPGQALTLSGVGADYALCAIGRTERGTTLAAAKRISFNRDSESDHAGTANSCVEGMVEAMLGAGARDVSLFVVGGRFSRDPGSDPRPDCGCGTSIAEARFLVEAAIAAGTRNSACRFQCGRIGVAQERGEGTAVAQEGERSESVTVAVTEHGVFYVPALAGPQPRVHGRRCARPVSALTLFPHFC